MCKLGSSPRVRGAADRLERQSTSLGIIPARAGSSNYTLDNGHPAGDHPRACGEQPPTAPRKGQRMGSSPRVRGAASDVRPARDTDGIIPARAGSRCIKNVNVNDCRDHPRACGEQWLRWFLLAQRMGSSPRVRGAGQSTGTQKTPNGIIPARAGSSGRKNIRPFFFRDHPRACGEQFCAVVFADCWSGSSPRVRGAADLARLVVGIQGIIPARAGSSHDIERHGILCRDHPRACGEQGSLLFPRFAI